MGQPDFLIIGARKSGTTWLYDLLKSHSEISMAQDRKEVHFFDRYYERGMDWYQSKFLSTDNKIIGEATPDYLSDSKAPGRIKEVLPEVKLICMLRNPIDRAYSSYKYLVQEKNYQESFQAAVSEEKEILEGGLYYKQLKNYLDYFAKDNLKIFIFEEVLSAKEEKLQEVCDFLAVAYDLDKKKLDERSNVSQVPRFKFLYAQGKKIVKRLYDSDLVWVVNFMKKIGLKELFFANKQSQFPPLTDEIKLELQEYYKDDVEKLEKLLAKDLKSIWNLN